MTYISNMYTKKYMIGVILCAVSSSFYYLKQNQI